MPIYEFYCRRCNTIYSFFSKTINTDKVPNCPPPIDEAKMEKAVAMLAGEADKINEDDPRQAAILMRKLSDATGMNLGPGMEEALSRMERGEDPEKIEAEMGDILEGEEPFIFGEKRKKGVSKPRPRIDETLYDL
jgi:hypothetical protein